ncbi:MAG: DNA polymerase III subunit chi [Pseudohongiellaceae bacterium]
MAQVSFYSLADSDPHSRLLFACRLTEKAAALGHRVFIQAESPEQAATLDKLLWTFKPSAFLPHTVNETGQPQHEAVAVGTARQLEFHSDVLINLADEPVHSHQRFKRINEIVCGDKELTARGRKHYRYYQGEGYEIETFKV